jgi:NADH/NAD ratio-sensing transcriptional regulator Rex
MDSSYPTIRAVIIGAGKDGSALLELFSHGSGVDVIGIADTNAEALGQGAAFTVTLPTASPASEEKPGRTERAYTNPAS